MRPLYKTLSNFRVETLLLVDQTENSRLWTLESQSQGVDLKFLEFYHRMNPIMALISLSIKLVWTKMSFTVKLIIKGVAHDVRGIFRVL